VESVQSVGLRCGWLLMAVVVLACGCSGTSPETQNGEGATDERRATSSGSRPAETKMIEDEETTGSLQVRETDDLAPAEAPPVLEGESLSGDEAESFLSRLPALPETGEESDASPFAPTSPPAPRTGDAVETIETAVGVSPSDDVPERPEVETKDEPLEVVRAQPEGEVDSAGRLSVTFSKPMVSLAARETTRGPEAPGVPLSIEPTVDGQWRWVGTKSIVFEPEGGRFPMSTEYTARLKGSAEAIDGSRLGEANKWRFSTRPLRVEQAVTGGRQRGGTGGGGGLIRGAGRHPGDGRLGHSEPVRLKPVLALGFNQRINRDEIRKKLKLWGGGTTYDVELVTGEELGDEGVEVNELVEEFGEAYSIIFRPSKKLEPNTRYQYGIAAGASGAEGDRQTSEGQYATMKTYEPLAYREVNQDWSWRGHQWLVSFNNELALPEDVGAEDLVEVDPDVAEIDVQLNGRSIGIVVKADPGETYEITVSSELQDRWGQQLGESKTVSVEAEAAPPNVDLRGRHLQVRRSAAAPEIGLEATGSKRVQYEVYRVEPSDWPAFVDVDPRRFRRGSADEKVDWPGEKVDQGSIDVGDGRRRIDETLSIGEALGESGYGHAVVVAKIKEQLANASEPNYGQSSYDATWVQVTDIGLDTFVDRKTLVGWASSLEDGSPLADVEMSLQGVSSTAQTDDHGTAELELPVADQDASDKLEKGAWLKAERGDDVAFLPKGLSASNRGSWSQQSQATEVRWYTADDREMYRPGETLSVKGWVRGVAEDGRTMMGPDFAENLEWSATGPRGNEMGSGAVELTETGGFSVQMQIPESVNLGQARLTFSTEIDGESVSTTEVFQVQEFRTPKFEANVDASPKKDVIFGESVRSEVTAEYFSGGPLRGAEASWSVRASEGDYRPPGWDGFGFGPWDPWWFGYRRGGSDNIAQKRVSGRTDGRGKHAVSMMLEDVEPVQPVVVQAQGTVTDVTRQSMSGQASVLMHPASHYVGLRTAERMVDAGEPLRVEAVATDIEGNVVSERRIEVRVRRLEWEKRGGEWTRVGKAPKTCTLTSGEKPVSCEVPTDEPGEYQIRASVTDDDGRSNVTEIRRWVLGGAGKPDRSARTEVQQLQLVPDASEYQPGETATVLVRSPIDEGYGKLVVWRDTMVRRKSFEVEGGSAKVEVPIASKDVPEATVRATVVGREAEGGRVAGGGSPDGGARADAGTAAVADATGSDDGRRYVPAVAEGGLALEVPPDERRLSVEIDAEPASTEPGSQVETTVSVTGPEGEPVADAEVALVAVDEAIMALSGYEMPSPLKTMYSGWGPTVADTTHLRQLFVPEERSETAGMGLRGRGSGGEGFGTVKTMGELSESSDVQMRKNLRPLAHFSPALKTDSEGKVTTAMELPDNLTRYRVTALAASGAQTFGSTETQVTARKPVTVRPSMPRFLNHGDEAVLPVLVRNQTGETRRVAVGVRSNRLAMGEPRAKVIELGAESRAEVRFESTAGEVGDATVQVLGAGRVASESGSRDGEKTDAAQIEVPVYEPATTEAFAAYGQIDEDGQSVVQPVTAPEEALEAFGGLSVTTSSTILQTLTDAFLYLSEYPYAGTEQLSSRVLSIAALGDVLRAFEVDDLPSDEEINERLSEDVEAILTRQKKGGGFSYWGDERDEKAWPFVSLHAIHALGRLYANGEAVSGKDDAIVRALQRGTVYIDSLESHIPDGYSRRARLVLRAYGQYVAAKTYSEAIPRATGADGLVELVETLEEMETPPMEAVALTLSTVRMVEERRGGESDGRLAKFDQLAGSLEKIIDNRVTEEAGTAQITTDYEREERHWVMASDRRVDAMAVDALLRGDVDDPLIPKLVRGLQQHRVRGRWANTQENVFVLLALREYFDRVEAETPEFVARMWLGDRFGGEHEFSGRSTESRRWSVPMPAFQSVAGDTESAGGEASSGELPLTIQKTGDGRMYYRVGMEYTPDDYEMEPTSRGFTVERTYEAVDEGDSDDGSSEESGQGGSDDIERTEEGWRIEAGTRVRVRVSMVAPARRYHVALVDRIPAGFEPVNPVFESTGWIPPTRRDRTRVPWWGSWYEHQNLRDSRAEAFGTLVPAGVYEYTYVAEATTPGTYHVPPARAEEMYAPEVFGRTGSKIVEVVEREE